MFLSHKGGECPSDLWPKKLRINKTVKKSSQMREDEKAVDPEVARRT